MRTGLIVTLAFCLSFAGPLAAQEIQAKEKPKAAKLGKVAPDFALKNLEGKTVKLSDYKDKIIVLEWYNPDCPFVRRAHTKGSLKGLSTRLTKNEKVVWLSINSSAPGKQGYGIELNKERKKQYGITNPVLVDSDGKVGRLYKAARTPQMYVLDQKKKIVYMGAEDNAMARRVAPKDQRPDHVNHIEEVVNTLLKGETPKLRSTKPVG